MEIKLKGRDMPRDAAGTVKFLSLTGPNSADQPGVLNVFTTDEVVELVNRAIYQLEYQRDSHRKRGAAARLLLKTAEEEMKKAGVDVGQAKIKNELEGK